MKPVHAQEAAFARDLQRHLHGAARALELCDHWCLSRRQVTVAQSCSLLALPARGALSMNELCAATSAAGSTTTRIVDQLVDKELVERAPDGEDRRVVRVALSRRGREEREAIYRDLEAVFVCVTERVEQRDRAPLMRGLRAVSSAMWELLAGCQRPEAAPENTTGPDVPTDQEVIIPTDDPDHSRGRSATATAS